MGWAANKECQSVCRFDCFFLSLPHAEVKVESGLSKWLMLTFDVLPQFPCNIPECSYFFKDKLQICRTRAIGSNMQSCIHSQFDRCWLLLVIFGHASSTNHLVFPTYVCVRAMPEVCHVVVDQQTHDNACYVNKIHLPIIQHVKSCLLSPMLLIHPTNALQTMSRGRSYIRNRKA